MSATAPLYSRPRRSLRSAPFFGFIGVFPSFRARSRLFYQAV